MLKVEKLLDRFDQWKKFWKKSVGTSKFEYSEGPLVDVLRTSLGRPELTSQGRPLDVISERLQDVRLGRPRDARSGRSRDGQIGSLGDVLRTLEGDLLRTSWGPIFAGCVGLQIFHQRTCGGVSSNWNRRKHSNASAF